MQKDGSLTNQQLAEKVGLSPSPCLRRVRALEEAGIIVRTVTILDHKKLGLSLTAIILIGMDRHTPGIGHFLSLIKGFVKLYGIIWLCGQKMATK